MIKSKKIGFIGGGQMGEAIFAGAIAAGAVLPQNIYVADISGARLKELAEAHGVNTVNSSKAGEAEKMCALCDILVLAVKPQLAANIAPPLAKSLAENTLVISIIGGVTTQTLESWLPNSPLIRVMPNTPMLVNKGCAGICAGNLVTEEHMGLCTALFGAVGECFVLPENLIDPLTAISGCGPAFAYMFIEALADGGVQQGLPRETAQRLAAQTLAGAAQMVLQTGRHPAALKDSVCSPGGGTIAGVHALEEGAFRADVMNAVAKSKKRMEKLGGK